ncbi:MAG: interleukin-like EMT inducer domain-containing protein, partial [Rudaea sp.]
QTGHTLDEAAIQSDRELAPRVLQFFGIRYIIWHTPYEEGNRDVANRTRAYVEQVLPVDKVSETYENGQGTVLYRVREMPPVEAMTIRPDDPLARLYFAEGWGAVGAGRIEAERSQARILFPLTGVSAVRLTIPSLSGAGSQVPITVDGHPLPAAPPTPAGHEIVKEIPASDLHAGVNELVVHWNAFLPLVPADVPATRLPIGRTGAASPVAIVVRSAGEEQGSFGHIYVNGVDASRNGRGYNLVVVDPNTGRVEASSSFDTFRSTAESERMAGFIAAIPEGRIVAAAVMDEASLNLSAGAVRALESLGAQQDLRGKFRWSHALIGMKGAGLGTALEAASETRVSQLVLGVGATEPRIAGSVGEIQIEAVR